MTFKGMDENVKRMEMKLDRLDRDYRSKKEDHRYMQLNFIGFAFAIFVMSVLAWQVLGDSYPATVAALMVSAIALIGLNIIWMYWKHDEAKKQKDRQP